MNNRFVRFREFPNGCEPEQETESTSLIKTIIDALLLISEAIRSKLHP